MKWLHLYINIAEPQQISKGNPSSTRASKQVDRIRLLLLLLPGRHKAASSKLQISPYNTLPDMGNSKNSNYKRALVPLTEDQLLELFKNHDKDGDGRLTKAELTQAFKYLGSRCSALRTLKALHAVDADGDGVITGEELNKLVEYTKGCKYTLG